MRLTSRLDYYRRIAPAYLGLRPSQLTFWHEPPEINERFVPGDLSHYPMIFFRKADYDTSLDDHGVPLLDYHGKIGLQYNPIAIAQFGLGNYNLFARTKEQLRRAKFLVAADWLVRNLESNPAGLDVWNHHFDWEYRTTLKAPWYSALAQGQGISLLVRAFEETRDPIYADAAKRAYASFLKTVDEGGVTFQDESGDLWLEEYLVAPPTHILNGFIWAAWGVNDYYLATGDESAKRVFERGVETLESNIHRYDAGFWSLYEQSGTRLRMLASPFYHRLHIVQLRVLHVMTGKDAFLRYADRWDRFLHSRPRRVAALVHKATFKLLYY